MRLDWRRWVRCVIIGTKLWPPRERREEGKERSLHRSNKEIVPKNRREREEPVGTRSQSSELIRFQEKSDGPTKEQEKIQV